jgi:hypothetical protein
MLSYLKLALSFKVFVRTIVFSHIHLSYSFRKTSSNMGAEEPTPENATLLQGFEWYVPADGKHYTRLHDAMPTYKHIGISNIWLPPGCKASSPNVSPPRRPPENAPY